MPGRSADGLLGRLHAVAQLLGVGFPVGDGTPGDSRLHGGPGDGRGHGGEQPRVERLGNQVGTPELEPLEAVGLQDCCRDGLLGQGGDGPCGGEFHGVVDLRSADIERPAEDIGDEVIIEMYNIWKNNDVDIVEGRKNSRGKENPVYKFFSLWFYKMINKSSGLDMEAASDFKLLDRAVVDSLNAMPERLTFFRAMSSWVGYKTERVYFDVADREIGESKWSVKGLFKFAINSITSFTSAPLQIVTVCGVITFIFSVILGLHTLIKKLIGASAVGFSTVIILQLLTSSIIMFSLGIIGFYLSKIYEEIKQRPRYIIRDIIRKDDEEKKNGKD